MGLEILTLGSSKTYTRESLLGGGAVVGKNVTISSITPIEGGNKVTFSYTLDDGTVKTSSMNVMDGIDGLPGKDGKSGKDGSDGIGISKIEKIGTVDLVDTYRITFTDNSTFDYEVKNGADGQGGSGGTVDVPIEKIKVNGELQTPVNKVVDITVPTKTSDLSNDSGYLTEHQDISGKVDKVDGKSLIADSEIERLASVDNYDDTEVKTQIQAVANGLMDSVGYSADYKTIDIIAKNGVKKSVDVAPIISHASVTELADVDTTNKDNGKALVYNSATSKHEYATISSTDEKVKMDASGDSKYLGELLDNVTIANENGELKVKKLDGQEVTITEINYLKGLTMNVMDLVNMFSNGGVKIINTPVATYAELLTLDKSSFIEGISYLVYVLADENHDNAKTTYLVDKDSETPTYFGFADSQRDFTTNPIDLATEITGKLGIANMDSDAIKTLFTVDDTYKTETTTNNAFSTHGAKALYDELLLAIGNKANDSDLTAHKDDTDIHVSTTEKNTWNGKANASDLTAHTDDADIHVTADDKTLWNTVEDKVDKTSIVTALDDTVTDEQIASALLAKTELDKKIDKTSIATTLSSESTDEQVVGALTAYNELQKLESATKEQFTTASGDYITVNDSVDGNIVELGIKGNSFQKSYIGKNILNNTLGTATQNGITCTNNGDGTYTLNGTATSEAVFGFIAGERRKTLYKSVVGKTLKFLDGGFGTSNIGRLLLNIKGDDGNWWTKGEQYNGYVFTVLDGYSEIYVDLRIKKGSTLQNVLLKPMLTTDLDATNDDFEPYVGGIPSPNPLYPQEINSVGDDGSLVVTSCGKNLIPYPYYGGISDFGITWSVNDGIITANGTSTGNSVYILNPRLKSLFNGSEMYLNKGKYILSDGMENGSGTTYSLAVNCYVNGNDETSEQTNLANTYVSGKKTFEITEDNKLVWCYITVRNGYTANNLVFKPMIRRCDENGIPYGDDLYEPHKETTTTIPLSEPLRAIGDIKDEITYQDGKWGVLRRITKKIIDENTAVSGIAGDGSYGNYYRVYIWKNELVPLKKAGSNNLVSNRFTLGEGQSTYTTIGVIEDSATHDNNEGSIRFSVQGIASTLDEYKTWVADNNIELLYELVTPTFEPFADQTLPYLSTYDGVTNISNDDALSAEMTVKYPTTDASGAGSRNESRIAKLAKDTDDKFDDVNESLGVVGKCKNLLNPTLQTTEKNGITCTNNGDGTYTLNGTATKGVTLYISGSPTKNTVGGYKLLGCPINGSEDTYRIVVSYYNNGEWKAEGSDVGNGVIIDGTYSRVNYLIKVESGATLTNLVFKPMLTTNLNATYDDFVPYTGDGDTLTHDVAELKNDLTTLLPVNNSKTVVSIYQTADGNSLAIKFSDDSIKYISFTS